MSEIMETTATCFSDPTRYVRIRYTTDNYCHRCGCALPDSYPEAFFIPNKREIAFYLLFDCPKCKRSFVFEYVFAGEIANVRSFDLSKRTYKVFPNEHLQESFSDSVKAISEKFVEIYHQSQIAETEGCTEICGMGYRKALEFLVKDYLCKTYPNDADTIKTEFLSDAIRRIEDPNIKTLAERCAWLGNDETHYVRKREDYKLDDLKRFIHALVYFLQAQLSVQDALSINKLK